MGLRHPVRDGKLKKNPSFSLSPSISLCLPLNALIAVVLLQLPCGVATIRTLPKLMGLFGKRAQQK